MLITINLYSNDEFPIEEAKKRIYDQNPVVFIVPEDASESVYELINISEAYKKFVYIIHDFNLTKVFTYLVSFNDLDKRSVMIFAPRDGLEEVKSLTINVCDLIRRHTDTNVENPTR